MPAYVFVEIEIYNQELYEEYKRMTPGTIDDFDGKFVVRGGRTEHLEGEWKPERIVLLEFPSVERAREWWESEAYTRARLVRQRAAETKMIILEGV
ncbi:MAG: DUF1330 domain-containing protein [Lutimonas sp.]